MNIIINVLLVSFTLSAFAAGTHEHKHEDDETHANNASAKSSIGQPAETSNATKTINVELLDTMEFAFSPALDVTAGDIVQLVLSN